MQIIMRFKCFLFLSLISFSIIQIYEAIESQKNLLEGLFSSHQKDKTAYQFGLKNGLNGLMTFKFPNVDRPYTMNDLLLGFLTTIENAVLIRIDSSTSDDYMELGLVGGYALMVYNLGTEDHSIGELSLQVNDGKYHTIRVTRSATNSTIQVDNHQIRTKSHFQKQLTIFNSHSKVQIGGKKHFNTNLIQRSFHGIISGLVFNGNRLLDLAAKKDFGLNVEGDVELLMSISGDKSQPILPSNHFNNSNKSDLVRDYPQMQQPKVGSGFEVDDLIYSGAGSGCFDADDEDECNKSVEASGDDLITPVYTPSSKSSTQMPPNFRQSTDKSIDSSHKLCDDDEDCIDGSGSGERTIVNNNVHPIYIHHNNLQTTKTPWPTWTPPTSQPIEKPPIARNYPIVTTSEYDHIFREVTNRPMTSAPVWPKPIYPISGPTRHPTVKPLMPLGPPVIYEVPALEIPKTLEKETPKPSEKVPKSANDRTVMIIGVIAIGLIVVVIIAPIVLFFKVKYRNGATYKIDENKKFQFTPVSAVGTTLQQTHLLNGGTTRTSPTDHNKPLLKIPKKKDLKEWYV